MHTCRSSPGPAVPAKFEEVAAAALAAVGSQPDIALDDLAGLLASAQERTPLVAVYHERHDPDVCYIGAIVELGEDAVLLRHVSSEAQWEDEEEYELETMTRVGFGGRYEEALALATGAPAI